MCPGRTFLGIVIGFAALVFASASLFSCAAQTADPEPPSISPLPPGFGMPAPVGARDASPVAPIGSSVVFGTLDGGSRATSIVPSTMLVVVDPSSGVDGSVQFRLEGAVDGTPVWSVTNTALGTVDPSGLFVASGKLGGETDVTARIGGRVVVAHVTVVIRYRQNGATTATLPNAGGGATGGGGGVGGDGAGGAVPDATVTALDGLPVLDPTLSLLYPYDQTVFPLGVLPPLLQWSQGANGPIDAVRIHVEVASFFTYDGYFGRPTKLAASDPFVRHPIPDDVWTAALATAAGGTLDVAVTLAARGRAYGALRQTYRIAPGRISGKIYYQAYNTALARNYEGALGGGRFGGATLSIAVGAGGPQLVAGTTTSNESGCRVCHSVSAYGDRMLVQHGTNYGATSLYDLRHGNAESAPYQAAPFANGFPGIHPDGRIALSNSIGLLGGAVDTALYDVAAGTPIAAAGLGGFATRLALPMFSPDGKKVAFVAFDGPSTPAVGALSGRQLVVMDFDGATNTFSNPRKIWETTATNERPAWPTFFPSSSAVVFQRHRQGTQAEEFTSRYGARGDFLWTDLATGVTSSLAALNGTGYLPIGPNAHDEDDRLQFEPTISPVASGGYAWIVFMSRRLYGNVATIDPWWSDPREHDLSADVTPKKLWMAALDLNPKPGTDPSHPAFYVPGQELHGSNSRPFFALDPCIDDGGTCSTGVECCGGYCVDGHCGKVPPPCSATGDRCGAGSDCCNESDDCVNGVCSIVVH
jgi:hypothetical protein